MLQEVNWEDFFCGGAFEDITNSENKVWIVAIDQDPYSGEISSETMFEVENQKRSDLLAVDCYLKYRYKETDKEDGNRSPEGIVTKYSFIHKMIDRKNNLILISDIDEYEFGGSEEIEVSNLDEESDPE